MRILILSVYSSNDSQIIGSAGHTPFPFPRKSSANKSRADIMAVCGVKGEGNNPLHLSKQQFSVGLNLCICIMYTDTKMYDIQNLHYKIHTTTSVYITEI